MRFLVDECTGPGVAEWLRAASHEVFSVYDESPGASDDDLLQRAFAENWIVVTNDKDFGEKVHRERRPHRGVILLRLHDERTPSKIDALDKLLAAFQSRVADSFVVVTETQIRFALP